MARVSIGRSFVTTTDSVGDEGLVTSTAPDIVVVEKKPLVGLSEVSFLL